MQTYAEYIEAGRNATPAEVLATEGALLRIRWTDDNREISLPASDFHGPHRTCANCAHNGSPTAPCGLCAGADAAITRWVPIVAK